MQKHNCTNTKRNCYQSLKHVAIHFDSFLFFRNGIPRHHKFQRKHKDIKNRMLLPSFPPALCIQYKRFETLCQGFLLDYVVFLYYFVNQAPLHTLCGVEPKVVLQNLGQFFLWNCAVLFINLFNACHKQIKVFHFIFELFILAPHH